MRPPRFRLRTLMIAVAVAGLVFGGSRMRQRQERFEQLAADHAAESRRYRLPFARVGGPYLSPMADWHWKMAEKYRRATRYPFLPVEPDPPSPSD